MPEVLDKTTLRGIAPIVPVRRVERTVAFYTEVLGFRLVDCNAEMTYAYVQRDDTGLMLLDLGDASALRATAQFLSAYVWVTDVATFWESIRPAVERLPANRVTPLFAKPDGRQEFHLRDPDGFLLFFGEAARG